MHCTATHSPSVSQSVSQARLRLEKEAAKRVHCGRGRSERNCERRKSRSKKERERNGHASAPLTRGYQLRRYMLPVCVCSLPAYYASRVAKRAKGSKPILYPDIL